ncbi:hypothetical protein [Photobacterium marinum]|nr:hypothetical protein [Photobacterium marinum]
MKRAIKLFIISYITIAFILLCTIRHFNNHYSEAILGDNVNHTIYSKKYVYHPNGIDRYKYMSTMSEMFLGLYDVESSLSGTSFSGVSHKTSSLLFLNKDIFSMKSKQQDHLGLDDNEHDFSEAHASNHIHEEFYQIVYNQGDILCSSSITTDSVQCFKFIN